MTPTFTNNDKPKNIQSPKKKPKHTDLELPKS